MVDIINLLLLVLGCILLVRLALWLRKRVVLIIRLKKLCKENNAELRFLRSPFFPMRMDTGKPDICIRILNTVYLIRLYSGGNKHYMVHFASERFSVRYMKMALRMLATPRRRATGIAYVESGKAFTIRSKVYVATPIEIPEGLVENGVHTENILLFNPTPHAVSYVLPEKTGIKVALIGEEIFGMKIFTGSSFVDYVASQAHKDATT